MHPVTEWAEVAGNTVIIARDAGEVWFYPFSGLEEKALPFATPMTCKGSLHSTVGLLDGAIKLAFERTDDLPAKADPSLVRYIYSLIGAYYTSKDTPRIFCVLPSPSSKWADWRSAVILRCARGRKLVTSGWHSRISLRWDCLQSGLWRTASRPASGHCALSLMITALRTTPWRRSASHTAPSASRP